MLKSGLRVLPSPVPTLSCRLVRGYFLGGFVLLSPPNFCGQSTVRGGEQEKTHSLLGKVDPSTTQIMIDAIALAYIQFSF